MVQILVWCTLKSKSYKFSHFADALRKDMGVVRDAVWIQLEENEVCGREEQLRQCLVGWFGEGSVSSPEFSSLNNFVKNLWSMPGGVKISAFKGALLLFEFEDTYEAKRVLARGSRRFKKNFLHLVRWTPEVDCLLKRGMFKDVWVRVLGLPLHMWSQEVFKKIGNCCGSFITVDENTAHLSNLQWARILVKSLGRALPGALQVVVGSSSFSFQLWWKVPPCFWLVVPRRCSSEHGEMEVRADGVGGSGTSTGVGKEAHPLPSVDMDAPCPYTKEKTGEAAAVEKAAEGGDFLSGIERGTTGKGMTCLEETGFKSFSGGLGFESQLLGSQGLEEAPSPKDMGLALLESGCRVGDFLSMGRPQVSLSFKKEVASREVCPCKDLAGGCRLVRVFPLS